MYVWGTNSQRCIKELYDWVGVLLAVDERIVDDVKYVAGKWSERIDKFEREEKARKENRKIVGESPHDYWA